MNFKMLGTQPSEYGVHRGGSLEYKLLNQARVPGVSLTMTWRSFFFFEHRGVEVIALLSHVAKK